MIRIDNYLENLGRKKKEFEQEVLMLLEKEKSIKIALDSQIDYEPLILELRKKLEEIDKELK